MNMQKRRFGRPWLTIIVTAAILTIAWLANSAIAQEAPPGAVEQAPSEATLDAVVAKRITYQGVLHEGGVPVTGNRNMTFNFFTNNACSGVAVYVTTVPNVPVTEGLFDVAPEINPNIFFGGGIWLEVEVAGAPLGCEPVYPAPYAFSLRPGAHIVGESTGSTFGTAVVNIESTAASWLNYHALFVRTATGHAVHAESDGIGVYGYSSTTHAIRGEANTGTAGYFTSNDGHGIYASTNSNKHYNFAGYFDANGGYGIYTHSELNQGIRAFAGDEDDMSSVWQPLGKTGVVGLSDTGRGVYGSSREGIGVTGRSVERSGVYGESDDVDHYGGEFRSYIAGDSGTTALYAYRGTGGGNAMLAEKFGGGGIAIRADNQGSTGSGIAGYSDEWYGVYGDTRKADHDFGFYTLDNLYSLNYNLAGAIMQVTKNGGEGDLEAGDVVVFSGAIAAAKPEDPPIILVAKAPEAYSTAVAGVVAGGLHPAVAEGTAPPEGMEGVDLTPEGPIAPGDYLLIVVQGPAHVKASALEGDIAVGDLLAAASEAGYATKALEVDFGGIAIAAPGTVFGKALEPLAAGKGLIIVYVTLQ